MTRGSLVFANGAALREKHERDGVKVFETRTTTLSAEDVATRNDTCAAAAIKVLTVSRIDPRKGLRVLPEAVSMLAAQGRDVSLDIVGPTIGQIGDTERDAIVADAQRRGVSARVTSDRCDPSRSVAADLSPLRPVRAADPAWRRHSARADGGDGGRAPGCHHRRVRHRVAGPARAERAAAEGRRGGCGCRQRLPGCSTIRALRRRLIEGGYQTARAHTLERQAADMMQIVRGELGLAVAPVPTAA